MGQFVFVTHDTQNEDSQLLGWHADALAWRSPSGLGTTAIVDVADVRILTVVDDVRAHDPSAFAAEHLAFEGEIKTLALACSGAAGIDT